MNTRRIFGDLLIGELQGDGLGGHFGRRSKIMNLVAERYIWPTLRQVVYRHVEKCHVY